MTTKTSVLFSTFCAGALLWASAAVAQSAQTTVSLVLKDHKFTPSTVTVPADQRIRIELSNQDGAAEEFDSDDLHAEKDVGPHGKVVIQVGPLKPGTYSFMGELHAKTATGQIVAQRAD